MLRWTIAGVIVIGLLAGIWLLWPDDGEGPSPTTVPVAAETTTTSEGTTTIELTTTTVDPTQVREVETVEQAEAILTEIYHNWFLGIYESDEALVRERVVGEELVQAAIDQFGEMEFSSAPESGGIEFGETEILRSDADCLVIWSTGRARFLPGEPETTSVQVLRWSDGWKLYSTWRFRDDLWQGDCDVELQG